MKDIKNSIKNKILGSVFSIQYSVFNIQYLIFNIQYSKDTSY